MNGHDRQQLHFCQSLLVAQCDSVLTIQGIQDSVLGPRVQCPYYSRNPGLSIGTQSTVSLLFKESRTQYWDPEYSVLTIQGTQDSVLGTVSLLFKESRTQYWDPEYIYIYSCCCRSAYAIDHAPTDAGGACKTSSQRTRARTTRDHTILITIQFLLPSLPYQYYSRNPGLSIGTRSTGLRLSSL